MGCRTMDADTQKAWGVREGKADGHIMKSMVRPSFPHAHSSLWPRWSYKYFIGYLRLILMYFTWLNHEIKRRLLLGRKVMTNLDSILKSRDITLTTKVRLVKAIVFPVVMYGCEGWTVKKVEHGRIDAFELWCWRRLLRVPWTARRSNQSILKEITPVADSFWYLARLIQLCKV